MKLNETVKWNVNILGNRSQKGKAGGGGGGMYSMTGGIAWG